MADHLCSWLDGRSDPPCPGRVTRFYIDQELRSGARLTTRCEEHRLPKVSWRTEVSEEEAVVWEVHQG